ncbi:hypothetical protein CEXT_447881 [Caerostris extrusa]|uniref:Uncharacterized protein n=1 Tax=Caerostris extrusa TaxID=172846 RepID=A0AAV4VB80_CAEEX|nr:hypothetical protein CEXT_447881 [Caerostris extrusa]
MIKIDFASKSLATSVIGTSPNIWPRYATPGQGDQSYLSFSVKMNTDERILGVTGQLLRDISRTFYLDSIRFNAFYLHLSTGKPSPLRRVNYSGISSERFILIRYALRPFSYTYRRKTKSIGMTISVGKEGRLG